MADTITSSNVLTVGFEYQLEGENKTIDIKVPDCKANITKSNITSRNTFRLFASGCILADGNVSLTAANVYTADETATEKIMIDIEGD